MSAYAERIAVRLRKVQEDRRRQADAQQRRWRDRMQRGRLWFDAELHQAHRRVRQSIPAYIRAGNVLSLITAPVIYSVIIPFALLDLWVFVYQWVCFPIYGIARVPRGAYFIVDRHKLAYLNGIEKVHCVFCGYANGALAFVQDVAARTEQYWCPIKHSRPIPAPHDRYHLFVDYGDAHGYRRELPALRQALSREVPPGSHRRKRQGH